MRTYLAGALLLLGCLLWDNTLSAQDNDQQLSDLILHKDSLFWQAYNTCDTGKFGDFFSDDLEFYHDKGGITLGLQALLESSRKNLCSSTSNFRLRREVVEGSTKVFPLRKNDTIYGAILNGQHVFYVLETGKKERLDGLAKFSHLWIKRDGNWKMTRVLSYDHGPAPHTGKRKEIALPDNILRTYAGKYKGPQTTDAQVLVEDGTLILQIGEKKFSMYAEKEGLFFSKERDLQFEFVKKDNAVTKMIVREGGNVVEELNIVQ